MQFVEPQNDEEEIEQEEMEAQAEAVALLAGPSTSNTVLNDHSFNEEGNAEANHERVENSFEMYQIVNDVKNRHN